MRFALLALVGVALAVHNTVDVLLLKPRNEYVFRFEGDVHSGLPLPTDVKMSRIQAMVHLQIPDDHHAIMKLSDIRFGTGEDDRKEVFKPIDDLKVLTISKEYIKFLEMPVRFAYKNGMVSDLMFFEKDVTWSTNVKRSIINMLQLNLNKIGITGETYMLKDEIMTDNDYFTVTERTIEGDCEVAYTILKKKDFTTEVSKSVNFDKCTRRPETMYNFRLLTECKECKETDVFEPVTTYNYVLEKDVLKNVEVRSVYTLTIQNEPVLKTEVRTRLTYEDVKPIVNEFEWNDGKKEILIYSDKVEKEVERFYMYGDKVEVYPYEDVKDKVETIRHIIDELKELKDNKYESTHLFSRLVFMFRMLTVEELKEVHHKIYMDVDERMKTLIEHTLATAGTMNTITHLIEHMKMENFKIYKLAHLLKTIQKTPYPSPVIVDEMLRFMEHELVVDSPVIRQTLWLTIGSLMRGVVGHTMDKTIIKENVRDLKTRYLNIIMKEFEKADTIYEKVLVLKTLANAGIDISVYELEKIILNKREELPVRMEAIDALRLLKYTMPRKIQSILMPVYQSRVEQPELRMAALVRIMHTLPHQPIILQIISTMEREPNQQVAVFTYDLLHSLAKSTHVYYKKLANEIRPLLTVTRFQRPERILTSTYKHFTMFDEKYLTGVNMDFATIFGKNSVWPKEMMVSLDTVFSGLWNKYFYQLGLSQQNIEKIVLKVMNKLSMLEKNSNTVVRGRRIRESLTLLKEIAKKLNIQPRVTDDRTPYVMLYVRYKDVDYAVLPIDERMIDYLLEKFLRDGKLEHREIERILTRDPEFQLHSFMYLHEYHRKVPTTLGLPLIMNCKLPMVMSAEGDFTIEMIDTGIRLRLNTMPSVASTVFTYMKVWNPIFEQGVKIVRSLEAQLPVNVDIELMYRNGLEVRFTKEMPTEEKTLFRFVSRPMTFFRFLGDMTVNPETELKTIVVPMWRHLHREKEYVYNIWGLKTVLRGNYLTNWNLRNVLLGDYDWEFVVIPTREAPKKIRFVVNIEKIRKMRMEKIDFTNLFEKEFEIEKDEYDMILEKDRREHFHRIVRDTEMKNGFTQRILMKVETVDSPVDRYGNVDFVTVCDEELRYCKLTMDGKRSPIGDERRDWKIFGKMQFHLPIMPKSLTELKKQLHREVQGLVELKWGTDKLNELNMKIQLEQSKEQKGWLRMLNKEHKGLTAYDLLVKASRLNQLKVVVNYDLTPRMKNIFEHLFNYLRGYVFWHSKVTMLKNDNNKIFLKLNVDPMSRRMINVLLETPYERMELVNFMVPTVWLPTIAKRFVYDVRSKIDMPVCEFKNNRVRTFDDVVFRVPLTNCYSIIAKDCSEEPRFVVMMKKLEKDSDLKKLKVIDENEKIYEVMMVDDKLKVMIDNKKINVEDMEMHKIELLDDNMVLLKLEDVLVRFDGYNVKVHMGKHMTERHCGLCGHFDEEKDNDFYTSKNEYTDDVMEFHKSYILNDKCEVEKDLLKKKEHYKVEKFDKLVEDDFEFFNDDEYIREDKKIYKHKNLLKRDGTSFFRAGPLHRLRSIVADMIEKTKVMEFPHRICFSLDRVPMCRKDMVMDEVMDKKVRFTCLPRSSHEARQLLHKVRNDVVELNEYPVSFVETIQVPRTCIVY
ncbi:hypothetical protein Q1695_001139 [Nippostrongylus brasiliensis]|nr:hypothetical protein Q1695_001139 [Nippostrongylus brasiliensis]